MTGTATGATPHRQSRLRSWVIAAIGIVLALAMGYVLTVHVTVQGITGLESFSQAAARPTFPSTLFVNLLVGFSVFLFVYEVRWGAIRVVLTVATALVIGFFLLWAINLFSVSPIDPVKAYQALLTGPISRLNRWGFWLDDTLGLALVGLAITIVFRAQLFSLGAEGQIYLGAMAAGLVALYVPGLPAAIHIPLALGAGCLVGFLWGLIPGYLRAYLDANELVSTLMLNPIGALIYAMLLNAIKPPDAGAVQSASFPASALLPRIVTGTRVTTAIFFVVAAVALTWLLIQRTSLGYAIRTIGANVKFARYGGINTKRTIVLAMALSGILAGLTGGYLALAIQQRLVVGISPGLAFEGIVVALLARNRPLAVPAMALMYSFLRVGGPIMQNDANVSLEVVRVIQSIIILLFTAEGLVAFVQARRARRAVLPVETEVTRPPENAPA